MLWDAPWRAVYRRSTVVSMSLGRPRRERAWRCWGESAHFDRRAGIIPPLALTHRRIPGPLGVAKGRTFVTDFSALCLRMQGCYMSESIPHGLGRLVVCSSLRYFPSTTLTFRRIHACEDHETVGGHEQSLWLQ